MQTRLLIVLGVSAWMIAATGCKHCNSCGSGCGPFRSRTPPPAVGAPVPVGQVAPIPPGGAGPAPAWPPPSAVPGPGAPGASVPPPPGGATRNFSPAPYYSQPAPSQSNWQPADSDPYRPSREPPTAPKLSAPVPGGEDRSTPAWPVGIPAFNFARERIAAGQKPSAEGLDWLRANGYRTVLLVRAPEEADAADRAQAEQRMLKFLSLEVSPRALNRDKADEFNRIVASSADLPLFVYDRDGRSAGALWYLHFRTAGSLADADARQRAGQLGLKDDDQSREMWQAIQNVLSQP